MPTGRFKRTLLSAVLVFGVSPFAAAQMAPDSVPGDPVMRAERAKPDKMEAVEPVKGGKDKDREEEMDLDVLLGRELIHPRLLLEEIQAYVEARVPAVPVFEDAAEWGPYADSLRQAFLDRVVFRGEAAAWRDAKMGVEWLDTIEGGPGYRIRKLRYEALPGLWIPALLYEPESLSGRVPVVLNVNGHEKIGKAVPYKQIRCINLAKRGMLALNVEWLHMGQLRVPGLMHDRLNLIDLCGTSGLAPFYLSMKRGLDLLLSLEHADPERVAVAGLSGGGWQTIVIGALDTRVRLANPVAGYSSLRTRARFDDMGDAEDFACDLGTVGDYTHLTALMAPRPTLLTFNSKDNCCFQSYQALPPLRKAALPIFKLYGKEANLRSHINYDPGTHNFDRENREAFYRMLGDHFYAGSPAFDSAEVPSDDEVKTEKELYVELPEDNADFQSLALALSENLPRCQNLPGERAAAESWQQERRKELGERVRTEDYEVEAVYAGSEERNGLEATYWWFKVDGAWTVPGVELVRGEPEATAILIADEGRKSTAAEAERLLQAGNRVLAVDPFFIGESKKIGELPHVVGPGRYFYFALLISAIGDRPLGLQAGQLAAIARWSEREHRTGPVRVVALGPRTGLSALVAAGLEEDAIRGVELHGSLGSLKEVIEQNLSFDQGPELFCFGLLEAFDIAQLAALVAPRPVVVHRPSDRVRAELAGLKAWYATLGIEFQPLR